MTDLTTLTDDGDTVDLSDGRTLRLKVWADDMNPFDEYDCYGKVASLSRDWHGNRPDGFDGNAEKLSIFNDVVWWQPPVDGPKRGTAEFKTFRDLVRDLASFGMHGVTLEILDGSDAYGRPIVVDVASLGGLDSLDDGVLADVLADLAAELEL